MINTYLKNHFLITAIIILFSSPIILADAFYERLPVDYENGKEDNEITRLQKLINLGLKIKHDDHHGYLKGILNVLNIPASTQTLVFSKTSLHRKLIDPSSPRALYFNKNTYVGWVKGAKVLEFGVADKNLGTVFYTLDQSKSRKPVFKRDNSCLSCHASSRTKHEPGFVIRSIFPAEDGNPIARAGEDRVNHSTDLQLRWGGWYVTANNFSLPHRGNGIAKNDNGEFKVTPVKAVTTADLDKYFDPDEYITNTSDIQALLVLEHQVEMHNILTSTKFRTIHAIHNEMVINKALEETGRRAQTTRILNNAAEEIIDYLLFTDEISLKSSNLEGIKAFPKDFKPDVPAAKNGASLTDFDFKERISKYPCSWVIYSDSFKGLPDPLRKLVLGNLKEILTADELPDKYIHLRKKRKAIHKILLETHKEYGEQ